MKTFDVITVRQTASVPVQAHEFLVGREGTLIFYVNNKPCESFAAGEWRHCREQPK